MANDSNALEILKDLAERPVAPFHEEPVAAYIVSRLAEIGLSPFRDDFGNVVAHYSNSGTGDPPIALVAHMDHPGFEIDEVDDVGPTGVALGGVPEVSLSQPADVLVLMPDGRRVRARTAELDVRARRVRFDLSEEVEIAPPVPVVFDLPDFELDGDFIRMRAADDLAGCAAALSAMERIVSSNAEADVYAVFTRAEEGGLFGARLMAEARTLPLETLVVSIESSPVIPGVEQGAGPVIRTGDALYTFDADAEQALIVARESIREQKSGVQVPASAYERWRVRGNRVRRVGIPRHWNGVPARQLPQRDYGYSRSQLRHRGRVHPRGRLPGRRGAADRGRGERFESPCTRPRGRGCVKCLRMSGPG